MQKDFIQIWLGLKFEYLGENETKYIGQWPRLDEMMKKTGGRKSRWTVPLKEQCHKAFTPIFFSQNKPICLLHIMHAGLCALKKHISYRPTVRIMYIKISWCKHICTNILYSLQGTHTVPWLYQVYTYEHVMVAYNTCTLYSVHIWYIYC